jgi:hypothetical protein
MLVSKDLTIVSNLSVLAGIGFALGAAMGQPLPNAGQAKAPASLGIAWGFLYGYSGTKAEKFMPLVRGMGGNFSKVYLFWNQIEPEKGHFQWDALDAFVNQLNAPEEGLISLFSTSTWAVEKPGTMLPPSPAKNPEDYYRFVHAVVTHSKGRVRYWQNDSEPNSPVYWAGTKEEFVRQLKIFHKAVKDADPSAVVVAGGYDGLFNPPGAYPIPGQEKGLEFFDYVMKEAADAFDIFDLRLYADPYTIPWRVDYIRGRMRAYGYEKPIIATEYGGPGFYEFLPNLRFAPLVMKWLQAVAAGHANGNPAAADAGQGGVGELYGKINQLPPQTQMFMQGCSPELQAKFERIQARDLVMRNVLALSAGVRKTLYWALHSDSPDRDDVMNLMYGKIAMVGYQDGELKRRYPIADVYQTMAKELAGVETVTRQDVPGRPEVFLFEVRRAGKNPLYVVWEKRDVFAGEDAPATPLDFEWPAPGAVATDAAGLATPVKVENGRIALAVSVTPVFIEGTRGGKPKGLDPN